MISFDLPHNWLRDQLRQRGLPQKGVADSLGIDAPAASRLISGKRKLQFDELPKLIDLLVGDSPEWRLRPDSSFDSQVNGRLEGVLKAARMTPETFSALSGQPLDKVMLALDEGGGVQDPAVAEAAANLLGVNQRYLQGSKSLPTTNDVIHGMFRRWGRNIVQDSWLDPQQATIEPSSSSGLIPIYAPPMPLGRGIFEFGQTVAESRAMPLLAKVPGAWGLFVGEGGVAPRFSSGDVLYIHPNRPVRHGDFAVARSADKLAMGTVSSDSLGIHLLDGNGNIIRKLKDSRLEKVVLATFD